MVGSITQFTPAPAHAAAGINKTINYQGRLLNAAGAVVADGTYNMEFQIWQDGNGCVTGCTSANAAANNGGTLMWTEDWVYGVNSPDNRVTVKNGYFSVNLGSICLYTSTTCTASTGNSQTNSIVDFNQSALYLSMNVGNVTTAATFAGASGDGYMIPFRRMASAVYALQANSCTTCILQAPSSTAQNTITPTVNSVVGLTVNATSGTAALALSVVQTQAADAANISVSSSGTTVNGLLVSRAVAGITTNALNVTNATGTTSNGLAITNSSGTTTTGISISQTGGTFGTGVAFGGTLTTGISFGSSTITTDITRTTGALTLQGTGGVTITGAGTTTVGLDTAGAGTVSMGTANATTLNIGSAAPAAARTTTINGGASGFVDTVNIGTGATTVALGKTINIGSTAPTGSGTDLITIGSNAAFADVTKIQGGNGTGASAGIQITPADAGDINVGTTTETGTIRLGQADATNTISIGSSALTAHTQTISIGNGAAATSGGEIVNIANGIPGASTTNTVAIGTAGAATGTVGITIGSVGSAAHITTIQGGGSGGGVNVQSAASGTINIGTGNIANTIQIGSTTLASGTQVVNLGNDNTAGGTTNVTVGSGSSSTGGFTTVQAKGVLTLTGGAPSTWDIGANLLSLQTAGNGAITTGTGLLTQGGNVTFNGTTLRTITGPTSGGLTINDTGGPVTLSTTTTGTLAVTSAGILTLTGAAPSTWDIGNNLLSLQTTGNGAITTGTGLLTQGGNVTFNGTTLRTITGPTTGGLTINDTGGPVTLSTTTSGTLSVTSAGILALSGGAASTLSTGANTLTVTSGGISSWANTSGNLTISTVTSGTLAVASAASLNLTGAAVSTLTTSAGGLTIDTITAAGQTLSIGTGNITHTIAIGTGTAVQGLTIGSTNGASTNIIQGGTGTGATAAIRLSPADAGDINIGTTTETGTIRLGQSTAANTINIGNGAVTGAQTIAIGTGATSGTDAITIGSTVGASATTIQGGTGNVILQTNSASAGVLVKSNTNSATALQLLDSAGNAVFTTDTSADSGNAVANPSFEAAGTATWAAKAGAAFSNSSAQAYSGTKSMTVTTTATIDDGVKYPLVLTPLTFYQFGFDAYGSSTFATLSLGYSSDGSTEATYVVTGQTVTSGAWKHYYVSFTTPASVAGSAYLFIKQSNNVIHTMYIDDVELDGKLSGIAANSGGYNDTRVSLGGNGSSITNLGIGTTSPDAALDINQQLGQTGLQITANGDASLYAANVIQVTTAAGATAISYSDSIHRTIIQGGDSFYKTPGLQVTAAVASAPAERVSGTTSQTYDIFQVSTDTSAPNTILSVGAASTSNLVTNPSFETDTTTGWAATASATMSQYVASATNIYHGVASALVTTSASAAGAVVSGFTAAITPGTYTFSYSALGGTNTGAMGVTITGGSAPTCTPMNTTTISSSGFKRYYCTFTSTSTNVTAITIATTGGSNGTFYLDGVELNPGTYPYAFQGQGAVTLRGVVNSTATFQNSSDSTNAFTIAQSSGFPLFTADTLSDSIVVKSNSTTALNLQNTLGQSIFSFDNVNKNFALGSSGNATGHMTFYNGTNGNTTAVAAALQTGSYTVTIPAVGGNANFCTDDSLCSGYAAVTGGSGYIQNSTTGPQSANFFIQGVASSVTAVIQGAAGQDITQFKGSGGSTVANIDQYGSFSGALGTFNNSASFSGASTLSSTMTNPNTSTTVTVANDLNVALVGTNNANVGKNTVNGINFAGVALATNNTFNGLYFGTNYDNIINYNGTPIINGTGILQSAALSGTYSNALTLSNSANAYTGTSLNRTAGALTVSTTTSGTLTVSSAGILALSGAAASTINTGANTLTVSSGGNSAWNNSSGNLTITTVTSGNIAIDPVGTVALNGTNFDLATTGVLTLAGAQTADITTTPVAVGTATALVFQPGATSTASTTGAAFTLQAGTDSGATSSIGGLLTLQGGNATGASGKTGGGVTIDAGTGTTAGTVTIAPTNAQTVNIGNNTSNTIVSGRAAVGAAANCTTALAQGKLCISQQSAVGGIEANLVNVQTLTGSTAFNDFGQYIKIDNSAATGADRPIGLYVDFTAATGTNETVNTAAIQVRSAQTTGYLLRLQGGSASGPTTNGVADSFSVDSNGNVINNNSTTTATSAETINAQGASGTQTNGLLVSKSAAGTTTNGIQVSRSAGTLTDGLLFTGTIGTDITRTDASLLSIQGTSGVTIQAGTTNSVSINTSGAGTVAIGDTNSTTVNIGRGSDIARTINIATAGVSNTQTVNIGSTNGSSTVVLNSGSNGIDLNTNGGASSTAGTTVQSVGNNSTQAFQVQNTALTSILNVNTNPTANLIANGGFESNTTGWSNKVGGSISRITTQQFNGAASMQLSTTGVASGDGATFAYPLAATTQYTFSLYAKATVQFGTFEIGYSGDGSTDTFCAQNKTLFTGGWYTVNCTFTTGAVSGTRYVYLRDTSSGTARTIYIDAVEMVLGSNIGVYGEGTLTTSGVFTTPVAIQPTSDSGAVLQVQASNGITLFGVDSVRDRVGVGTLKPQAGFQVTSITAATPVTTLQGASLQTGDMLDIIDNNSVTLDSFDNHGNLVINNTTTTATTAATINTGGASGTQTNGLLVSQGGAGTTSNGIQILQSAGTLSTGLLFGGTMATGISFAASTITTDITRTTGALTLQGTGGVTITGAATSTVGLDTAGAGTISLATTNATTISVAPNNIAHTIHIGDGGTNTAQTITIGSIASSTSTLTLGGGIITTTNNQAGVIVGNGYSNSDTNLTALTLDSTTTFGETAGTCAALVNNGALYYNSTTNVIRSCTNAIWSDVTTNADLGELLFGVVPDSGVTQGDLGGANGNANSPCKVYWVTATTWSMSACTAYSGGRKVRVAALAAQTITGIGASAQFENLCLNTSGVPTFSGGANVTDGLQTSGNLTTGATINQPLLCLATFKGSGVANTMAAIYDIRTFTTTTKTYAVLNSGTQVLGGLVTASATGLVTVPAAITTPGLEGVIVAATGSTSSAAPNVMIATAGPQWVKVVTATFGQALGETAASGYATGVATATTNYNALGVTLVSAATSCSTNTTLAATDCQFSAFTNISIQ